MGNNQASSHWQNFNLTCSVSGLGPGLTLAQGFLEDQKEVEDELDEEEEIGGYWGDKGVGAFVRCVE